MCGRAKIEFHLPARNRFFLAIFVPCFLDALFDAQGAPGGMCSAVTEEAFGKFVVIVCFAAFLELGDSAKMPGSIMQLAEFADLVVVLIVLFLVFLFFDVEIFCVIARVGLGRLSLWVELENGCDRVIQKRAVV